MTVTKNELTNVLVDALGLSQTECKQLVDAFFDTMREAIVAESGLKLANFGNFEVKDKAARPGRNPKSGQLHEIKARRVVTFHPSPFLRSCCNPELPLPVSMQRKKQP